MMKQKTLEIWVGILMLLALAAFTFMAFKVSGLTASSAFVSHSYTVNAQFSDVGGLKTRAAVRIAGVQVGEVSALSLNPETYEAKVSLSIENDVHLPTDTSAAITASGILGDNYISLTPGYASQNISNGGTINTTYAATSIQSLISTFMSGAKKS
jgi:phospholipid/cholesterol/gamma-HCH transport system substrate-binding protein